MSRDPELNMLRRENARLKQEKADLELLIESNIEHSDYVTNDLMANLESISKTLTDRIFQMRGEIGHLKHELQQLQSEKGDLELLLDMNAEHSDFITEGLLAKVDATVRESERRFRLITEATPIPMFICCESDQRIVYTNEPFLQLYGETRERVLQRTVHDFLTKRYSDVVFRLLADNNGIDKHEVEAHTASGIPVWGSLYARSLEYNSQPCFLFAFHDLTERRKAEEMKSKFIALTSHELRTPLAVIMGNLELIDMYGENLSDVMRDMIRSSSEMSKKLASTVNNIADLARLSTPDPHVEFKMVDLRAVLVEIHSKIAPFLQKRELTFKMELQPTDLNAEVNEDAIWQVLMNLLLNAIRYTPNGGEIRVGSKVLGPELEFWVQDTGIGIPPDEQHHIFSRFYGVKNANKHQSGTIEFGSAGVGVGLSIAKAAIELHDGQIWLKSQPNQGSTFFFRIPKEHTQTARVSKVA